MKKIKVAIIDSGVEMNHPLLSSQKITGIRIYEEEGKIYYKNEIKDVNGHGTAVAGIIFEKCYSGIDLLSISILDKQLKCQFTLLKAAFQFAINFDVQVINLSLGTILPKYQNELKSLCDLADEKGILVVAAVNNYTDSSYPANFANVFGVRSKFVLGKYDFILNRKNLQVYANGYRQKVYSRSGSYIYQSGNSFAAAHFTGILAHILFSCGYTEKGLIINHLIDASLNSSYIKEENNFIEYPTMKKGLLFPINDENIERIRMHEQENPQIIGFYDYREFLFDNYQIATSGGYKKIKIFTKLEEGLEHADTLLIGDLSYMSFEQRDNIIMDIIKKAVMLEKNVFLKDAIYVDENPEIYQLAREKGVFIRSKYN